jgi:hypothetical protein
VGLETEKVDLSKLDRASLTFFLAPRCSWFLGVLGAEVDNA